MDSDIRVTIDSYARRYGLSPTQRLLLAHAVSGLEGPQLAAALGASVGELKLLESLFTQRTGRGVRTAVREIEAIIRSRSSRPPSQRTARPQSGIAPRPGASVRKRTGTSEDE